MPSVTNDPVRPPSGYGARALLRALVVMAAIGAIASSVLLTACVPAVIGGAAVGVSVIHDRRSPNTILLDQRIELSAIDRFDKHPVISKNSRISATSYNLVVLLTGQAASREIRDRYAALISFLPDVRKVVNQVTIGPNASLAQKGEDAYLTSRVKVALASVKIPGFDPTRAKVVTELGAVHLMGLLTPQEESAVLAKVRYVPGVEQVVNLIERYDPGDV